MKIGILKTKFFIEFPFAKFMDKKGDIFLNTPINAIFLSYKILFPFINSLKVIQHCLCFF